MNLASILVLVAVGTALFFSVRYSKKSEDSGCSGICTECPMQCKIVDKK